jgi:hypothetical protein
VLVLVNKKLDKKTRGPDLGHTPGPAAAHPPRPPGRNSCGLWPWVTCPIKAGFVVASKRGNLLTIQKEKENKKNAKKRNKKRTRREVSLTKT